MKKKAGALLIVSSIALVFFGVAYADEAQVKIKYGSDCKIVRTCGDMMYVDCNAAADGPAYYLDGNLDVIGTSGGLCMGGHCSGAPKEWTECDGRQSDGPSDLAQ